MKKEIVIEVFGAIFFYMTRQIISLLPNWVSSQIGSLGYTKIIKRSPSVRFTGFIYGTKFQIYAQGNYAIERMATQRKISANDPFLGLKQINLSNCTAIDIGANVGSISIGMAYLGAKRVYSIEPGPLSERLEKNIDLNDLRHVISVHNVGFAKSAGELFWAEDKNNPGNAHLLSSSEAINLTKINSHFNSSEFRRVPVVTLDQFARDLDIDTIDIIKVDVEGMEWDVLQGGKAVLEKYLPCIVAETHRVASDMMGYDCISPMFEYLYSLGYSSFSLQNGQLVEFIYPNFEVDTFFIHKTKIGGQGQSNS